MTRSSAQPELIHATCVALEGGPGLPWPGAQALLLRGPPGAGKSDLALRLIDAGWRLVADDQCQLRVAGGRLLARAPDALAGKLEVRGLGIVVQPYLAEAPVALLVELVAPEAVERLPESAQVELLGIALPRHRLHAFDPSAPAKLRLALHAALRPIMPGRGPGGTQGSLAEGDQGMAEQRQVDAPGVAARHPVAESAAEEMTKGSPVAPAARRLVLVTGLSGAGRSTALNTLEDLGYETIDNLPLELLQAGLAGAGQRPIALGIDIRARNFAVDPLLAWVERLNADPAYEVTLLFLDCDDEILRRRYSETRRRHPLALDRPLLDGIYAERRLIAPLNARADLVIDTSSLTPGDFRNILTGHLDLENAPGMAVFVMSFSYRLGLPRAADMVFDARFLANPHYEAELRPLSGRDETVAGYIRADPGFGPFYQRIKEMLLPLLPRYEAEGKSYLTIAFGCTGGRHRSVMLAESLAAELRHVGRRVTLVHRDLEKQHNARASDQDSA
ncbi:MAG: RNase adapter RapZ [Kiloniellales bacterium]